MGAKAIPDDVRRHAEEIIERFNSQLTRTSDCRYIPRFKGKHLHLDRADYGKVGPICRLTYTGKIDNWDFAIFKWSDEIYDPDEWMFPGSGHADGTIEGAMKAGMEAYPA